MCSVLVNFQIAEANRDNETCLHFAARMGCSQEMILKLLEKSDKTDLIGFCISGNELLYESLCLYLRK